MKQIVQLAGSAEVIVFRAPKPQCGFTSRDLLELHRWERLGCRLELDDCAGCGAPTQFAMIYQAGESWASWAVSRENGRVLLWDCVTLADIGRFATMDQALAAVPGIRGAASALPAAAQIGAQVIPLRPVAAGCRLQ